MRAPFLVKLASFHILHDTTLFLAINLIQTLKTVRVVQRVVFRALGVLLSFRDVVVLLSDAIWENFYLAFAYLMTSLKRDAEFVKRSLGLILV
jgi:hypothetical protein